MKTITTQLLSLLISGIVLSLCVYGLYNLFIWLDSPKYIAIISATAIVWIGASISKKR